MNMYAACKAFDEATAYSFAYTPELQFAISHAVSDNRFKRMNIISTRYLVDYQPQDDAFKIFQSGIRYRKRWYVEDERRLK